MNSENEQVTDVKKATYQYFFAHPKYYIPVLIVVVGAIFLSIKVLSVTPLILILAAIFGCFAYISGKMRHQFMKQFSTMLGYSYTASAPMSSVQGSLFNIGYGQSISDVITGKDGDMPVRIFLYQYTVGSGKNSHTYHYTIFENTFNSNIPHMILHSPSIFFSEGAPFASMGEHISLEGDFNKYFSLSVEKGFETEAYEIFTPDFMEELIETSKSLGFEFSQNKLSIYKPLFISKRDDLDAMFELSKKLCTRLEPVITGMKGDVDAARAYPTN